MPATWTMSIPSAMVADRIHGECMPSSQQCHLDMATPATTSMKDTSVSSLVSLFALVVAIIRSMLLVVLLALSGLTGLVSLVGLITEQGASALQGD
jgi:hypothetical protein